MEVRGEFVAWVGNVWRVGEWDGVEGEGESENLVDESEDEWGVDEEKCKEGVVNLMQHD